ncbi:AAA family ATPase [Corallococcus sp. ZKHCc1 1396]|uniref:AAA family ATPase n=2 Tax=Corallococcus soli TaxID=2710757 RepID=A0ABR9PZ71_9BACT|nr:AAA family ATPase [Corallococcus soli]MBE4753216.1 AAA family ATPase [Corallococcus soli]
MTRFDPSLQLRRLVVTKSGHHVYNKSFHSGVNIIRGKNSVGKSTIADMIFYALGGEGVTWKAEAALCDYVTAEVSISGSPVTLRREIGSQQRPMSIFWGNFEAAERSASGWDLYPYAHRSGKESFSQVLFRALGIPEVRGELSSLVTMHQLLRLIYADQRTAYDRIFRHDDFDKKVVRDAVGALLCGFYDEKIYDAEFRLRNLRAEHGEVTARLQQLYEILGDYSAGTGLFADNTQQKEIERAQLYAEFNRKRSEAVQPGQSSELSRQVAEVEEQLRGINEVVLDLRNKLEALDLEISDSNLFISSLQGKVAALDDAVTTSKVLGDMSFEHCPECRHAVVAPSNPNACYLCKELRPEPSGLSPLLRLQQEMMLQLGESETLQSERKKRRERFAHKLPPAVSKQTALRLARERLALSPAPAAEIAVQELYRQVGYLDREIEELQRRSQLAETLKQLTNRQSELSSEITKLDADMKRRREHQASREADAVRVISGTTAAILGQDLDREKSFHQVSSASFDFSDNSIRINDRANYSASSMVIAKNAFHLALLISSTQKAFFRYPRFALFDNIEDKGMEQERSRNFQRIIVKMSQQAQVEHQIIFTTSMIAPELDVESLVVGDFYTEEKKSLEMPAAQ